MRTCTILILTVLTLSLPGLAYKKESLDELIKKAEAAELKDQPKLFIEVAQRQLKAADKLFNEGQNQQAQAAVKDVVTYANKGTAAATRTGKRLKKTEIAVRKMADRLRDIKRSVDFAQQAPVQSAVDQLEKMRTALLTRMFGGKE